MIEAGREPGTRPVLAERLRALIARRASGGEGAQLAVFARLLVARADPHLERLPDEDATALVSSAFRFYAAPGPEVRVRAFTPEYAEEGWDAPVSVIETCMPDRPFVVDTIRARLAAAGIPIETFLHPILAARRDAIGRLTFVAPPEGLEPRESFTHVAIPRTTDRSLLARLEDDVRAALGDVRLVTDDFELMLARCRAIVTELGVVGSQRMLAPRAAEAAAAAEFLRWLADGAFVFLGYREYALATVDGVPVLQLRPGTGLGLLRREARSAFATPRRLDTLPGWVQARLRGAQLLSVAKTAAVAPVHRRVRMDDVVVLTLDAQGRPTGVRRLLGLFSSKAHAEEASEVPLLRPMLQAVLAAAHVVPGSHDHKEIVAIFDALPKAGLLASTVAEVEADVRTILAAQRAEDVVVAVRAAPDAPRVVVLVVLPRARFSSEARTRIRDLLLTWIAAPLLEDHVAFGEGEHTLLYFAFAATGAPAPPGDALEEAVVAIVRTWPERLRDELIERHGPEGERLAARFALAFPGDYQTTTGVERAADEVACLARVAADGRTDVRLRNEPGRPTTTLQFYLPGAPLVLSEFMPVLENLGLRALAEDQIAVRPADGARLSLQAFHVQDHQGRPLPDGMAARLADALLALHAGRCEDDPLNRLVLEAGLDWRAVHALRAYAAWAVQGGLAARPVVTAALADHPAPAALLVACFEAALRPGADAAAFGALRADFLRSLDGVESLREDMVLRGLLAAVEATVRTTFFTRPDTTDHVALKLRSADIAWLPLPRPLYEIWVHAPTMEGIHLRAGRIARGGIRASDRPDDFRTEILGLMRTQTVKNAIIVPTGAKGGFVVKGRPGAVVPVEAYRTLVRGLLELTDNLVGGRVVHPPGLVVRDEEDPYLVVAADKGTATFSDVANALAAEHDFWLGDAFASGGSHGYDHKALGITARGAWECVRRHCREMALDADTAALTVAGIGDMGGDVFGNGLLRSPHLRLRAAFNHQHVFLDPDPDPARSFAERQRLFAARGGWEAYDPAALSAGGAVVPRTAKQVTLSPEAQAMLALPEATVSGERLVQAVLGLDVDLLWNGGIGTYVAGAGEPDTEVRDAVNDAVRVRAPALRARIVAEGGNLGFTQRARIEFALAGGRINTDAVDNSAGVDLSDHEVNLKICLRGAVESGKLGGEERNALLAAVTEEMTARVLAHNRAQSRALGLDQVRSRTRLEDFRDLGEELERGAGLDRVREQLPDHEALRARRGHFLGLTRPELAVLMGFAKLEVQRELRASPLVDDPIVVPWLVGYFPTVVAERFPEVLSGHPLRREIVATELANLIVDELGATFLVRIARDAGAGAAAVARALVIAWVVAGGAELAGAIAAAEREIETDTACAFALERACERLTKWVLVNTDPGRSAAGLAAELGNSVQRVRARLPEWVTGREAEAFHRQRSALEMAGLPARFACDLAVAEWLPAALDVVTVAAEVDVDAETAAARYWGLAQHLDFAAVAARIAETPAGDRWQRRALAGLRDDLERARRLLTRSALRAGAELPPVRLLAPAQNLLADLQATPRAGLAALAVVVRAIGRLAEGWT